MAVAAKVVEIETTSSRLRDIFLSFQESLRQTEEVRASHLEDETKRAALHQRAQLEQLRSKEKDWLNCLSTPVHPKIQDFSKQKVKLDVGGVKFTTMLATLHSVPSLLSAMFSGRYV